MKCLRLKLQMIKEMLGHASPRKPFKVSNMPMTIKKIND